MTQMWNNVKQRLEAGRRWTSSRLDSAIPADEWWLGLGSAGSLLVIWAIHRSRGSWQRYPSIDHLTRPMYDRRARLTGRVISVGDGDNFRLYHVPWMWRLFSTPLKSECMRA
jgi:hypothetical protein